MGTQREAAPRRALYPLEKERAFLAAVERGEAWQARLDTLLAGFLRCAADDGELRTRAAELIALTSRAAVRAGADPGECLRLAHETRMSAGQARGSDELFACLRGALDAFAAAARESAAGPCDTVRCLRYIEDHCDEKITLEQMARMARLTPAYFSRVFHRETGETFQSYLQAVRVARACELLRGGARVIDAAAAAGFDDPGYFTKVFRRAVGVTPREYRKNASALSADEVRRLYETRLSALELRGVSFTYQPPVREDGAREMPVVLKDFTLTVRKGEYVAFTGPSGSGKSTVLKLLMGLYPPDAGERRIVCRDGGALPLDARCNRLFGYVPQGSHLMSGTVREIVAYADPARARDDEALWRALDVACASEFVRELTGGLDAALGERGAGLSEGQMQRLSIARALFAGSPVLMLDECTSALDEATERRLLGNLRSMTDRTVLAVTHHPAALAVCDRRVALSERGAEITEGEGH